MSKNERYNASGCKDLTSYEALQNVESEERFKKFIKAVFRTCDRYGFRLESRIVVTDKKTGKIWR